MATRKINLTYGDDENNNYYSYVSLKENLKDSEIGESVRQVSYDGFDSDEVKREKIELILDFDKNDKIIGIEIISNRVIIPD